MTILIVLIPLGLLMLAIAIAAFVWAVSSGQYEDLDGEAARILFEDDRVAGPAVKTQEVGSALAREGERE